MQSPDHLSVWVYLLTHATAKPYKVIFAGQEIELQAGQLITSKVAIARWSRGKLSESKIQRILKAFEADRQIEQLTTRKGRLISLTNWTLYQSGEPLNDPLVNDKRPTNDPLIDPLNSSEKRYGYAKNQASNLFGEPLIDPQMNRNPTQIKRKEKNIYCRVSSTRYTHEISEIIGYLNERTGKRYQANTAATVRHISARLRDGYSVDDCKAVIDTKCRDWLGTEYEKYLRPDTLFGSKFDGYLNAAPQSKPLNLNDFFSGDDDPHALDEEVSRLDY